MLPVEVEGEVAEAALAPGLDLDQMDPSPDGAVIAGPPSSGIS
jgi:hypothetical protein